MVTARPVLPPAGDLECNVGLGRSISGGDDGSGCSAFEVAPASCRMRGVRCAHTRWRWVSVAALLLAWASVCWVLRHNLQVFDLLARRFRVSAAGGRSSTCYRLDP